MAVSGAVTGVTLRALTFEGKHLGMQWVADTVCPPISVVIFARTGVTLTGGEGGCGAGGSRGSARLRASGLLVQRQVPVPTGG